MEDAIWESHKPELESLYIHENQTLPNIMKYMKSEHSFEKKKSQYEKYFKRWGFRKNQAITASQATFIGIRVDKRKRVEEKESEVYIHGVQYPPDKLKKSKYGKTYVSRADALSAPSPGTPEGVLVCTPGTPGMGLIWGPSLPWLRFSKLLRLGQTNNMSSLSSTIAISSPETLVPNQGQELMRRLSSTLPWEALAQSPNVNTSSRALSILMPEEYMGQHRTLAVKLRNSQPTTLESLKLEFFLLSNDLYSAGSRQSSSTSWELHDKRVIEMFHMSGWKKLKQIKILLSIQEPTAWAITEKIFASALRLFDLETIRMMLEAGMDPNGLIETAWYGHLTPLQFAANNIPYYNYYGGGGSGAGGSCGGVAVQIMELLLSHEADINSSYNEKPPLYYAIKSKNRQVVRILLSHGAIVTPSCLALAAGHIANVNDFNKLLGPHMDVNAQSKGQYRPALAEAILNSNLQIVDLLLARGADADATVWVKVDGVSGVTTLLGLAITADDVDFEEILQMMQSLLWACTDVNPDVDEGVYFSPLTLAVKEGYTEIAELLLKAGVDIQVAEEGSGVTLLERAAKQNNMEMCELLVAHGAMVNRPSSDKEQASSALLIAVKKNYLGIIGLLIENGARLDDVYSDAPGTILAGAIEIGDEMLLDMLYNAGAKGAGSKLRRIKDLKTAIYLQKRGTLQQILDTCGARILTSSLLARDKILTQWLLDYGVAVNRDPVGMHVSSSPRTPLGAAIRIDSIGFTNIILNLGAEVTDSDLAEAVNRNNPILLQHLLTGFHGSAPTAAGKAVLTRRVDILEHFIKMGVDPRGIPQLFHGTWNLGYFFLDAPESVLEIAAAQGDKPMLQALLQLRFWDPVLQKSCPWDPRLTSRALTIAIIFHHTELAEYLLESMVDANQEITVYPPKWLVKYDKKVSKWYGVVTPLQAAVREQHVTIAYKLIQDPATKINYLGKGKLRRTALQHAVETGNMELVNLLLDHGADINAAPAVNGGATALQIAAIQGYLGIARMLIDMEADINAPPARRNGRTALEGAAEYGRIDMLQMLLDEGALLVGDYGERQYERAHKLAVENGHNAAARLLRSFKSRAEESAD